MHPTAKPRHITMAVFPVSCPSEPNQIFYYIILQFLPPICLRGPGALLAPSAQEMFPLQPSVVMGGHIGNQSRNRRRAQRAGPPALGGLLFGQEILHHGRIDWEEVNMYDTSPNLLNIHKVSMHVGVLYACKDGNAHICFLLYL